MTERDVGKNCHIGSHSNEGSYNTDVYLLGEATVRKDRLYVSQALGKCVHGKNSRKIFSYRDDKTRILRNKLQTMKLFLVL